MKKTQTENNTKKIVHIDNYIDNQIIECRKKKQEKKNILKYLKLNQEKINEFIKTIEPSAMGENDPP